MANLIRGPGLAPPAPATKVEGPPGPSIDTTGFVSPKLTVPAVPLVNHDPDIMRKIMAAQALTGQAMNLARCLVNQLRGDDPWRADKTREAMCNLLAEIGLFADLNKCQDALKQFIERTDGEVQGETDRND